MMQLRMALWLLSMLLMMIAGQLAADAVVDGQWLQRLYSAANGSGWIPSDRCNRGWTAALDSNPCFPSPWSGVTCSNNSRVIELKLQNCNLRGTLPELSAPGAMSEIQTIDLLDNQLSGIIPSSWSSLPSLQYIDVGQNVLTGSLQGFFSTFSHLYFMSFASNRLSGTLPASYSGLSSLRTLNLGSNGFSGSIPSSYGSLSCLQFLSISANALSYSIPASLSSLSSLQELHLDNNQLTESIPAVLSRLSSLQHLVLSNNVMSGTIPETLGSLSSLMELQLGGNQLTGSLPTSFSSLSRLQILNLGTNQLTSLIPSSWSNLSSLYYLDLTTNKLSGPLPASFSTLSSLRNLYLGNNQLNGTLPSSWSRLTALQIVNLGTNQITGSLPPSWSNLGSLQSAFLDRNLFTGELPSSWSSLSSLQSLYLQANHLNGSLPSSWSQLRSLRSLQLTMNDFSGELPLSWYDPGFNISEIETNLNCLDLSSAIANPSQWTWWMAKSKYGVLQRSNCYCQLGQLASLDGYWCEDCPTGYYCPNTSVRVPCPAGTYNPSTGKHNVTDACVLCPVGRTSTAIGQNSSSSCNVSTGRTTSNATQRDATSTPSVMPTVAVAGVLPLILLSAAVSSAGMLQRSLLQLQLSSSSCSAPLDAPVDPASSPTQLALGDTNGAYVRGSVVGNLMLMAACGAGSVIAVLLRPLLRGRSQCGEVSLRRADAAALRIPGLLATPFMFLLQPTVSNSLSCLVALSGGGADVTVGAIGIAVCAGCVASCVQRVGMAKRLCEAVRRRRSRSTRSEALLWMFTPLFEWRLLLREQRGAHRHFLHQYGLLFDGYRWQRDWFLMVEMAVAVASGVIGGLQPWLGSSNGACRGLVASLTAVNLIALVFAIVFLPYQRGWELVVFVISNTLAVLWGIASLIGSDSTADQLAAAQVWLLLVQLIEVVAESVVCYLQERQSLAVLPIFSILPVPFYPSGSKIHCRKTVRKGSDPLRFDRIASSPFHSLIVDTSLSPSNTLAALIRLICGSES